MPPWAEALPRLFEIYRTSGHAAPGNGLQQPNVWRGLLDNSPGLEPIENDLQVHDPASWAVFQLKAARLVHLLVPNNRKCKPLIFERAQKSRSS